MARKKPARSEGVAGATRGRRAGHGTAGTVARGTPETVAHGEGRRPSERRGGRRRPIEAGKTCLDDHMLDGQRTTPEHRKTPIANLAGPPEPGANLMRRVCSANPEPSIIRVLYENRTVVWFSPTRAYLSGESSHAAGRKFQRDAMLRGAPSRKFQRDAMLKGAPSSRPFVLPVDGAAAPLHHRSCPGSVPRISMSNNRSEFDGM